MGENEVREGTREWWHENCPSLNQAEGYFNGLIVEYFPEQKAIKVSVRSRGRAEGSAQCAIKCEDAGKVAFLAEQYNARDTASIVGKGVLWSYADGHGMCLGAVLRRGESQAILWVPGMHRHGPGTEYLVTVSEDGIVMKTPRVALTGALHVEA